MDQPLVQLKTCIACGIEKPLSAFTPFKRGGSDSYCKSCRNAASQHYVQQKQEQEQEPTMLPIEHSKTPDEGVIETIPLSMLFIDERYQRPLNLRYVKYLRENWNPGLVGVLIVSWRDDGRMAILDGQHRFVAMKQLQLYATRCLIFENLSSAEESKRFYELNHTPQLVGALHGFFALYFAKEPSTVKIVDLIHTYGLKIKRIDGQGNDCIDAVRTLENIVFHDGLDGLARITAFLVACWKPQKGAFEGFAFSGVSIFFETFKDELEEYVYKSLVQRAGAKSYEAFLELMVMQPVGDRREYAFAKTLYEVYNANRPARNRLPPRTFIRHYSSHPDR